MNDKTDFTQTYKTTRSMASFKDNKAEEKTTSIKRFELDCDDDGPFMDDSDTGEYVLYEDLLKELAYKDMGYSAEFSSFEDDIKELRAENFLLKSRFCLTKEQKQKLLDAGWEWDT